MDSLAISIAAWMAFGQPAFVQPPAPPREMEDSVARSLRRSCISDAGVALILKSQAETRQAGAPRVAEQRAIEKGIAEAAHADPVDIEGLQRGKQARNDLQHRIIAEMNQRSITLLRRLSPSDRAIYARRMALLSSAKPGKTCPDR